MSTTFTLLEKGGRSLYCTEQSALYEIEVEPTCELSEDNIPDDRLRIIDDLTAADLLTIADKLVEIAVNLHGLDFDLSKAVRENLKLMKEEAEELDG